MDTEWRSHKRSSKFELLLQRSDLGGVNPEAIASGTGLGTPRFWAVKEAARCYYAQKAKDNLVHFSTIQVTVP